MFRHTHCAARLQTLDRGAPVGPYTVARELGHDSTAMSRRCTATSGRCGTGAKWWSTGDAME
jgi:integrase